MFTMTTILIFLICKLCTDLSVIDKEIMVIIMGYSLMEDVLIYKECLLMDSFSCSIIIGNNKICSSAKF